MLQQKENCALLHQHIYHPLLGFNPPSRLPTTKVKTRFSNRTTSKMRTKLQIIREEFGVQTPREAITMEFEDSRFHAHRNFAQTKLQLPYEAPEHPELPSVEEIDRIMNENTDRGGDPRVCRIGPLMIKRHIAQWVLQVSTNKSPRPTL
jgi:hypothetical protein